MAIKTVTVFKINGSYFPDGCEREISCGEVKSLDQNVSLALPSGGPLECDEDDPDAVITEIIQLPNGDKWWIEQGEKSIVTLCSEAGCKDVEITVEEDYDYELNENCLVWKIAMKASGAENVKIGTTDGGDEIMLETALPVDEWHIVTVDIPPLSGGGPTLYFTGITESTQIKIYLEKL